METTLAPGSEPLSNDQLQRLCEVDATIDRELPKMQGWCSPEKAKRMARLVVEARGVRCVELGIFGGRSLAALALPQRLVLGEGVTDGIDPFTKSAALEGVNDVENDKWWSKIDYEQILTGARDALAHMQLGAHARIYRERSQDAAPRYPDDSIDVLHVDSNHSVEVSCQEVSLWHAKVRPGGFWIADDIRWSTMLLSQERLQKEHGYVLVQEYVTKAESWRIYQRPLPKG